MTKKTQPRPTREVAAVAPTGDEIRSTARSESSWSHFNAQMRVQDTTARQWYKREAVSQTWNVAALARDRALLDSAREVDA